MPVTHGVTGSSPVRTAKEKGFLKKGNPFFVYCQRPTLSFVVDTSHSLQIQKCKNAKKTHIYLKHNTLSYHQLCKTFAFSLQKGEKGIFEGCLVPSDSIFHLIPIVAKARGEMLNQIQHDVMKTKGQQCSTTVILNLFQDLSADKH